MSPAFATWFEIDPEDDNETAEARSLAIDKELLADFQRENHHSVYFTGDRDLGTPLVANLLATNVHDTYTYREDLSQELSAWLRDILEELSKNYRGCYNSVIGQVEYIMAKLDISKETLTESILEGIQELLGSPNFKQLLETDSGLVQYRLIPKNRRYYLDSIVGHLPRMICGEYHPTTADVAFIIQRRRGFSRTTAILSPKELVSDALFAVYIWDLTTHAERLMEDESVSILDETSMMLSSYYHSRWMGTKPLVLFLVNLSAFKDSFTVESFRLQHHDYSGGDDPKEAIDYITGVLRRPLNLEMEKPLLFYPCDISDESNLDHLFALAHQTLVMKNTPVYESDEELEEKEIC
ncbi:hypothetical protein SAPIO_CDS4688 [Scedosporium apiospermum]|uniref:Uncharacterized protein n=1 Tax=Pseudallescheria apiosperma TaxID=563466 RepID=A0A084G824_PSEDA|nr:uncharacterized protein SAPIO_CDS4688 [Scedosporium apiospermum]KEZ43486.1 hypothetical protein SAPIO_CDS4688 [Scedosporium apiospermum]